MGKQTEVRWLSAVALITASLGCSMCDTGHMCDYAAVGGKWQRSNPTCGRVGSILSDAGAYQSGRAIEASNNYGDAWGIMDSEFMQPDEHGSSTLMPNQLFPEDLLQDGPVEMQPEAGSILIGP